ncbi:hypothetical protein DR999_PMT18783 [Platysternon megacephalum]|uniref:Inhibitory synaptic factor 1 n=1 Tax=Platysternon megacephalum TaxID=55544 RepID=A0A4D9DRX8_9SAUR|nr:hypothetical protein DR999_PMT18783 [Platysternon megacephalum]
MSSGDSQDTQPSEDPAGGSSNERERIRCRMKMVIGQLEGILQELKEVAKELREIRHPIPAGGMLRGGAAWLHPEQMPWWPRGAITATVCSPASRMASQRGYGRAWPGCRGVSVT